jgi:uncharacterized protein YodC (DUF2158 family)
MIVMKSGDVVKLRGGKSPQMVVEIISPSHGTSEPYASCVWFAPEGAFCRESIAEKCLEVMIASPTPK